MARVLSTATVLALLAATALAFALTERAKLERSPIGNTRVDPVFSPDGKTKPVANVVFKVKKSERVTVWIEDRHGSSVGTIMPARNVRANTVLRLVWNGFTRSGETVPDGTYRPVVKLERSHRTIVLPSTIVVDTKPPTITVPHPVHAIISPDGDGHHDTFTAHYRAGEPGHGILSVRGDRVWFTRCCKTAGTLVWNGKLGNPPTPVRPGNYVLSASAEDVAGNVSKPVRFAVVQVRYVALGRDRVVVRPGATFAIRVSTDAPAVSWILHGRHGTAPRGTIKLRAPRSTGVFRLYVSAAGHSAKCTVVVA